LAEQKSGNSNTTARVCAAMLQLSGDEFQHSLDICRVTHGAYTEHLQGKLEEFLYTYKVIHYCNCYG